MEFSKKRRLFLETDFIEGTCFKAEGTRELLQFRRKLNVLILDESERTHRKYCNYQGRLVQHSNNRKTLPYLVVSRISALEEKNISSSADESHF